MANTTVFDADILKTMYDDQFIMQSQGMLLPELMYREVDAFTEGKELKVRTFGDVTIQDFTEQESLKGQGLASTYQTLTITSQKGARLTITENDREDDASGLQAKMQAFMKRATWKMGAIHEIDYLAATNNIQTNGNDNSVLGQNRRRYVNDATNLRFAPIDVATYKYILTQGDVPADALVGLLPASTHVHANSNVTFTSALDTTKGDLLTNGLMETGGRNYLGNIYGVDLFTTPRLPVYDAAASFTGGSAAGKPELAAAAFFSVADDMIKPLMHRWRRAPRMKVLPEKDNGDQSIQTDMRYGFAQQNEDSLVIFGVRNAE